jgi:phosphopantothenoylcysteine decarboxylase / phosphopantothenate---cysteine ligase
MHAAVMARVRDQDVVIMAAAVADYTPAGGAQPGKVAKQEGPITLALERTRDILADLGRARDGASRPVLVGFAAETSDVVSNARAKLASKRVDLVVANDVSRPDAGFEVETNAATIIGRDDTIDVPLCSKRELAGTLLDRVEVLLSPAATPARAAED